VLVVLGGWGYPDLQSSMLEGLKHFVKTTEDRI
jgi:hypothetical protein